MNEVKLKGIIQNIQDSHSIQGMDFGRATLVVPRLNGKEDSINIRYKKYSNPYQDNQEVTLSGNLRSYSSKLDDGRNKVELYVFTYFDQPEVNDNGEEDTNRVEIDGRICKIEEVRKTKNGKTNLHLIVANNIIIGDGTKRLNSYIPCIAWGKTALELKEKCSVNTRIRIIGELHSRDYRKVLGDSGEFEIRIAHECVINEFEIL